MQILQFIFSNPFHFFGIVFLLIIISAGLVSMGNKTYNYNRCNNCENFKNKQSKGD